MGERKHRLKHLLELAAEGPSARAPLARELCDILVEWPPDYALEAKRPFEALLEKTLREVDETTRTSIAARFALRADAPAGLLHQFFFAPVANDAADDRPPGAQDRIDEDALLRAARGGNQLEHVLARAFKITNAVANEIVSDTSARALAIACKGAHAGRATFSALAMLSDCPPTKADRYLRLAAYDAIPQEAAERLLAYWRSTPAYAHAAAE